VRCHRVISGALSAGLFAEGFGNLSSEFLCAQDRKGLLLKLPDLLFPF
jgi:hypothetical protein